MAGLSRDEVRAVDRYAIDRLGIRGVVLMENAGRQVADAAEELLTSVGGRCVTIVAGAGNNGGDGYVAARHLNLRGYQTSTFVLAPREKIRGDALLNLVTLESLGGRVDFVDAQQVSLGLDADLIVDALGGTGVRGALRGATAAAVEQINAAGKPVLAVDIPSGLDCDSGDTEGPAVIARRTVTFLARKKGFDNPAARRYTGMVTVADIGIDADRVTRMIRDDRR